MPTAPPPGPGLGSPRVGVPVALTLHQGLAIMPRCLKPRLGLFLPFFNEACWEFDIHGVARVAAFVAQLAHESGEWMHFEELSHNRPVKGCRTCAAGQVPHAAGEQYEGRLDLGNERFGDGQRYKGRGPIQLTGRANYRRFGQLLGVDLEELPDRASDCTVAFRVAGAYWRSRDLNALADAGQFDAISKAINGGTNGAADRRKYHARALAVLTPQPKE